ncbi:MAG: hypothetical protein HXN15_01665, partial [Porphyromonadaceae bacterium]|nr:hypothetical protein [Porphyromonadaceae bacterium]
VITTDESGAKHATLLAPRLTSPQCKLVASDFNGSSSIEFGVEAVNTFGVATPCTSALTISLPDLKALAGGK